jgi:hypothetical protein
MPPDITQLVLRGDPGVRDGRTVSPRATDDDHAGEMTALIALTCSNVQP